MMSKEDLGILRQPALIIASITLIAAFGSLFWRINTLEASNIALTQRSNEMDKAVVGIQKDLGYMRERIDELCRILKEK